MSDKVELAEVLQGKQKRSFDARGTTMWVDFPELPGAKLTIAFIEDVRGLKHTTEWVGNLFMSAVLVAPGQPSRALSGQDRGQVISWLSALQREGEL